jgi:hypothetical protein
METPPTQQLFETKAVVYPDHDTARRAQKMMRCHGWDAVAEQPVAPSGSWWRRLMHRSDAPRMQVIYRRPFAARPYALFQAPTPAPEAGMRPFGRPGGLPR